MVCEETAKHLLDVYCGSVYARLDPLSLWLVGADVAMTGADEISLLSQAHSLFAGTPAAPAGEGPAREAHQALVHPAEVAGPSLASYRGKAESGRAVLASTADTDTRLTAIVRGAADEHAAAGRSTKAILDAARADGVPAGDTPLGQRQLMARRAARLRASHRVLSSSRARALRRLALLRALHYPGASQDALSRLHIPGAPNPRAGIAVRAALSKLGCPYVWGATGPSQFDCSGLTQWAYKQAGLDITRSTYTQVSHGVPVPRSMVAVGDLVFPEAGHVQMYIGDGKVVEAPHTGANVRISQMPSSVYAVRRPMA